MRLFERLNREIEVVYVDGMIMDSHLNKKNFVIKFILIIIVILMSINFLKMLKKI